MATLYYASFGIPERGSSTDRPIMQIKAYDDKNGVRPFGSTGSAVIYHGTRIVSQLYQSLHDALKDLNAYRKAVLLPSGETVLPVVYNGYEEDSPFIRWQDVQGELWPGEPGWGNF